MAKLEAIIDASKAVTGGRQYNRVTTSMSRSSKTATADMMRVNRSMGIVGKTTGGLNKMLGGLVAGFGAFMAIRGAVRLMADFQLVMAQVRGVTGAIPEEFERLTAAAREMGAQTQFTAKQAGEGLLFLARAGFSVNESIEALPHTLNLATAGVMDLGRSADIASNVLRQFNLDTSQTERIVDVLINTANSANVNVEQLAESMKLAGPVAGALGISVEETAAAIGAMGDAGIQGTMAGTQLRGMFAALLGPTSKAKKAIAEMGLDFKELNPEIAGLLPVLEKLADGHLTAERAVRIFGRRQASGALILTKSIEKMRELTQANVEAEGAAEDMAAIMRDTLIGQWKQFISAIQEVTLQAGDTGLVGSLKDVIKWMTEVVRTISGAKTDISLTMQELIYGWALNWEDMKFKALSTVAEIKQGLAEMIPGLGGALEDWVRTIERVFTDPLDAARASASGLGVEVVNIMDESKEKTKEVATDYLKEWVDALDTVKDEHKKAMELIDEANRIAIEKIHEGMRGAVGPAAPAVVSDEDWARTLENIGRGMAQQEQDSLIALQKINEEENKRIDAHKELLDGIFTFNEQLEATAVAVQKIKPPKLVEAFNTAFDQFHDNAQKIINIAQGIGDAFGNAFEAVIFDAMSARDAVKMLIKDIARTIFRELVTKQITRALIMGVTGAFSAFAEKGLAIHHGNVLPFQAGGIVNRPTYFPLSGGRTGLMGENGPEAIMPLKRGPGGRLGIETSGGGSVVQHVTIHVQSPDVGSFNRSRFQIAGNIKRALRKVEE